MKRVHLGMEVAMMEVAMQEATNEILSSMLLRIATGEES